MTKKTILGLALAMLSMTANSQVLLDFDLNNLGPKITPDHYGLFFEEINHAGDGGLYAELINNRSFDEELTQWNKIGNASLELIHSNLLNDEQHNACAITFTTPGDGISNNGFWGINIVKAKTYRLSFFAQSLKGYKGNLTFQLLSKDNKVLGETTIPVKLNKKWKKIECTITANGDATDGLFAIIGDRSGTLNLDVVSLMPPTHNNRANGMRPDLAEKLLAMKPAFLRFPGGCYVEGFEKDGKTNRYEWKKTIGPIEEREGHLNNNWHYWVSDGMGFHEYLELCEDLNAEAMFVVNLGMGHNWCVDYREIDEYIQEALDAIEYAKGDITTPYGKLRAKAGHPEPFKLKYIEIGNENYNYHMDNNVDESDHYPERYYAFYQAIKSRWPDVVCIGNVEAWATDNPSWRNEYPAELLDEHYYRSPGWFMNNYNKYDTYPRNGAQIYVGEYAVTENSGAYGTMNAAIGEAVFMQGMENNSDVVRMTSYAPLFVNENQVDWRPDLIRFNSHLSYGTPSYYVQRMFANNVGKQNIRWTEKNNVFEEMVKSTVGVGTWRTASEYFDVSVSDENGNVISANSSSDWKSGAGKWAFENGHLSQQNADSEGATDILVSRLDTENYTLRLKAKKHDGKEGFLIIFDYKDQNNFAWWNIGGWDNTKIVCEQCVNGGKFTTGNSIDAGISTGEVYDIYIEKHGKNVKCFLNDKLVNECTLKEYSGRPLYAASSIDDDSKTLFVKLVNPNASEQPAHLTFRNGKPQCGDAEILVSDNGYDENTTDNPFHITPKVIGVSVNPDSSVDYTLPPFSVNILRLKMK